MTIAAISSSGPETVWEGPGFIDLQVNGYAGIDFNGPDFRPASLEGACRAMARAGVTGFLATLITAGYDRLAVALEVIEAAVDQSDLVRRMVRGVHLEGPHINPEDGPRGAHPREWVVDPDWGAFKALYDRFGSLIKLVTVAPERPGALEFIERAAGLGVVVALGHCAPEPEVIEAAVAAGARLSTHLGNGAHDLLPRHRNYIQKQMAEDRLAASIICDLIHLPEYFVKNLIRAKGPERIVLITDATAAAAAPPGRYTLGNLAVEAGADGVLRLPGTPYLAGSTLTMDRAVYNCFKSGGVDLETAVKTASVNPGRLLGLDGEGDRIVFRINDSGLKVLKTYLAGELIYSADTKE